MVMVANSHYLTPFFITEARDFYDPLNHNEEFVKRSEYSTVHMPGATVRKSSNRTSAVHRTQDESGLSNKL